MVIGFLDITGKGHLTSLYCFLASLYSLESEKDQVLISLKPDKTEYYLGIKDKKDKSEDDLARLTIHGRLTPQLLRDYTIEVNRGLALDYLDGKSLFEKAGAFDEGKKKDDSYYEVLAEYVFEIASKSYDIVFADLSKRGNWIKYVDILVLGLPQYTYEINKYKNQYLDLMSNFDRPIVKVFNMYFSESSITMKRLAKDLRGLENMVIDFSYPAFEAYARGEIIDYIRKNDKLYDAQYKTLQRLISTSLERSKK